MLLAQEKTKISVDKANHDFGLIKEDGGDVGHVFVLKNAGKTPLVIDRITTSCGCAQPEWSKDPVPPGGTKEVKIWYDPYGRPGQFYKTISVFSNADPRRFVLSIKGEVARKPDPLLAVNYPYSIGDLKLLSKTVAFNSIRPTEILAEKIDVKNAGEKTVVVRIGELPSCVTAEARPVSLAPNETGELVFLFDATVIGSATHYWATIPVEVRTEGAEPITQHITLTANIIDDFSKLSASDRAKAPSAQIASTLVDFGKVANKTSILGIGGKETRTFEITNKGKSVLVLHSVSSDDPLIDVSGGKKEIKPGASASFKVTIRPKDFKAKLESTIIVICNDPNGPVRLIKVTAEK